MSDSSRTEAAESTTSKVVDIGDIPRIVDNNEDLKEAQRRRKAAQSAANWNQLLTWAREQRGPQWDYGTEMYHVPRDSPEYFANVQLKHTPQEEPEEK